MFDFRLQSDAETLPNRVNYLFLKAQDVFSSGPAVRVYNYKGLLLPHPGSSHAPAFQTAGIYHPGCRHLYRPVRERDVNLLKEYALTMLKNTGQEEITFSSLSSSDYRGLPELTDCLIEQMNNNHVNILSSWACVAA